MRRLIGVRIFVTDVSGHREVSHFSHRWRDIVCTRETEFARRPTPRTRESVLSFVSLKIPFCLFIGPALFARCYGTTPRAILISTQHWLMPVPARSCRPFSSDERDQGGKRRKGRGIYSRMLGPRGDARSRDGQIFVGHKPWNNRGTLRRDKSASRIVQQILEIRRERPVSRKGHERLDANWFHLIRRLTLINRGSGRSQSARSIVGYFARECFCVLVKY